MTGQLFCETCGGKVHFSNGDWKHTKPDLRIAAHKIRVRPQR